MVASNEEASNEDFKDAVDVPEGAQTTAEKDITP